jgi:hypothetical protein
MRKRELKCLLAAYIVSMKTHFSVRCTNDEFQHSVTFTSQEEHHTLKTTYHVINSRCLNDFAVGTHVILICANDTGEINEIQML